MDLSEFLLAWRTTPLPDREVIDALVHPGHAGPSTALAAALAHWPGSYYWSDEPDGRHLVLTRRLTRRRERWGLHVALFLATLFTTTFVGAVFDGRIHFDPNPFALITGTYAFPRHFLQAWATGLRFSVPLLAILLCHELGHYLAAGRYHLDVSPPYFIPVPFVPWSIGTMGAFIRLRTLVSDRRQLLDVGIAGPIAGLVVAIPVLWLGLRLSHALPGHGPDAGMLVARDLARPDGVRRLAGDRRDHVQSPADLAARRRARPLRGVAAVAPADRSCVLDADPVVRLVLARVAAVGAAGAAPVARPARSPSRPRRAPPAPAVAPRTRVGGTNPLPRHVRAGAVQNLKAAGSREQGAGCCGAAEGTAPCSRLPERIA